MQVHDVDFILYVAKKELLCRGHFSIEENSTIVEWRGRKIGVGEGREG